MVAVRIGMVHVIHGPNEGRFPVGGKSVGNVKRCLKDAFSIPYFAEAFVDGKAVTLDHVLAAGRIAATSPGTPLRRSDRRRCAPRSGSCPECPSCSGKRVPRHIQLWFSGDRPRIPAPGG
jgi:hypothetical protein